MAIPEIVISSGPDSYRVQRSREPEGSAKLNLYLTDLSPENSGLRFSRDDDTLLFS